MSPAAESTIRRLGGGSLAVLAAMLFAPPTPAAAQSGRPPSPPAATPPRPLPPEQLSEEETMRLAKQPGFWHLELAGGAGYVTESDFDVASFGVFARASNHLTDDLTLSLRVNYSFNNYDFDGGVFPDPWSDVHLLDTNATLHMRLDHHWSVFGGPIFQLNFEDGADLGDAWTWGGILGARYEVGPGLVVGGGLSVISQLQDPAKFFPVFQIEWEISDDLRVSSETSASTALTNGVEVELDLSRHVTVAVGGGYQFRRFALDGSGLAADGVGEDKAFPVWGRITWKLTRLVDVTAVLGALFSGDQETELDNGTAISTDYNPALLLRLSARIRF